MEERKKEVLRVYNRKTVKGQYPNGLAYSVHLSVKENEEECPLLLLELWFGISKSMGE